VVGIRSLGSIPRPVGKPRDGSSSLRSPSKLRARWGLFRSYQPLKPVVRPSCDYRSVTILIGAYGPSSWPVQKLEFPGSRCLSPLSTK
jgi:hypothetical protein